MQEEQEEMIKTGKPEKRRPSGFKNGVIIGLVLGLLITGIRCGADRAWLSQEYEQYGGRALREDAGIQGDAGETDFSSRNIMG